MAGRVVAFSFVTSWTRRTSRRTSSTVRFVYGLSGRIIYLSR